MAESPRGTSPQPLTLGLVFPVISIFCLHHTVKKIHTWKLFTYGKIFAHGKIKSRRNSLVKKKKKNMPEEERKSTILSRKEKNSSVKATSTGVVPRWRPDFELRSHRQIKICHTLC